MGLKRTPGWQGAYTGTGGWIAGSTVTNPTTVTVLVDTGAISRSQGGDQDYLFAFLLNTITNSAVFLLQHRNAANTATLSQQEISVGADSFAEPIFGNKIPIANNERVRVMLKSNVTGDVQCSIFSQEVLS